jgi:hypothetical protein
MTRRFNEEEGRSLAFVGTQLDRLSEEFGRGRYERLLAGILGAQIAARMRGEDGFGRLNRTLREAELGGHDVETVLRARAASDPVLQWQRQRDERSETLEQERQRRDQASTATSAKTSASTWLANKLSTPAPRSRSTSTDRRRSRCRQRRSMMSTTFHRAGEPSPYRQYCRGKSATYRPRSG